MPPLGARPPFRGIDLRGLVCERARRGGPRSNHLTRREEGGTFERRAAPYPRHTRGMQRAGLCDSCRHQRLVRNTRGSTFSMCGRSKLEPGYPKYPRIPVFRCGGYERRDA